jgi:hypothetical protein
MIVRHFNEIEQSSRAVHAQNWSSFRLLTRDDGMGFSLHETWIHPNTQTLFGINIILKRYIASKVKAKLNW